jgi:hypothetical protein
MNSDASIVLSLDLVGAEPHRGDDGVMQARCLLCDGEMLVSVNPPRVVCKQGCDDQEIGERLIEMRVKQVRLPPIPKVGTISDEDLNEKEIRPLRVWSYPAFVDG